MISKLLSQNETFLILSHLETFLFSELDWPSIGQLRDFSLKLIGMEALLYFN